MPKRNYTLTSKLLFLLAGTVDASEYFIGTPYQLARKLSPNADKTFYRLVHDFKKKGWIRVIDKNNERFIKITKQGELQALFLKARVSQNGEWDGKWRLIIFDIPEESKNKRAELRNLLKANHFQLLQDSVYISPYGLHREAIEYLKTTRLIGYIRILKVEEIDNDRDLRKSFKLDITSKVRS